MPRKPRQEGAGAVHHVFARGVNRRTIFIDAEDRVRYLAILALVLDEYGWECLAYCLMTNHVHLLIRTPKPNLGRGMQRLHSLYAQGFNERHGRLGHLFQDRYGSSRIHSEAKLLDTVGYIEENPVAAGICAEAQDWPWSSAGALRAADAPRLRLSAVAGGLRRAA